MASKKRGGLSKREYAAAQKAKVTPKKIVSTTRATASKAFNPKKESIFDYTDRTGQQSDYEIGRSASTKMAIPFGYKTLTEPEKKSYQTSQDTYRKQQDAKAKSIENRKKASQALDVNKAKKSGGLTFSDQENGGDEGFWSKLFAGRGKAEAGRLSGMDNEKLANSLEGAGTTLADLGNKAYDNYLKTPTALAYSEETPMVTDRFSDPFSMPQGAADASPLDGDQAAQERAAAEERQRTQDEQDLLSGARQQGNGAVYQAPAQQEPNYDAELKKQMKGMGFGEQEDDAKSYYKKLLAALDPEYAAYQKQAQDELEKSKRDDIGRLMGIFAGNNTADSEQRAQQQELVQNDYATQLINLLAKLARQKQDDRLDIEGKKYNALNEISNSKRTAQQRVMDMLATAQSKKGARTTGGTSSGKLSHNDIFNWTNDALAKGYTWQEIADNAAQQGIDTSTGSYLDQLLNNANKQSRFL